MEEIWKPIGSYPPYEASSLGRIRGLNGLRKLTWDPKIKYLKVGLTTSPGKQTTIPAHRLICIAFHGEPPFEEAQALHRNGIRTDISPDNLYWGTHQQNMDDKVALGNHIQPVSEDKKGHKLDWPRVREIRKRVTQGDRRRVIAKDYGIDETMVTKIHLNKYWPKEKDPEHAIR